MNPLRGVPAFKQLCFEETSAAGGEEGVSLLPALMGLAGLLCPVLPNYLSWYGAGLLWGRVQGGPSLIHVAVQTGNVEMVRMLVAWAARRKGGGAGTSGAARLLNTGDEVSAH